jgi:sRNA-binding protein
MCGLGKKPTQSFGVIAMIHFTDELTMDLDQDIDDIIALLAERWPECFAVLENRRRPLKVGIHKDIQAALGTTVSSEQLSRALVCYCSVPEYQSRLKDKAARIDLDGRPAGVVTAAEALWARAGRGERMRDKRKSAPAVRRSSLVDLRLAGVARRKTTGGAV